MTLNKLQIDKSATIKSLSGPTSIIERLDELGFHCGVDLQVKSRSSWGGPLIVQIGQSYIAVRIEEAQCIHLQTV